MQPFLSRGATPAVTSSLQFGRAIAAAQRGAWSRALVTIDEGVAATPDPIWPLYRYRLAVVAARLGAVGPGVAAAQRPAVVPARGQLRPENRAEPAWLRGAPFADRHGHRYRAVPRSLIGGVRGRAGRPALAGSRLARRDRA